MSRSSSEDLRQWPDPPADEGFYGLAGDFVRFLDPHTEADPVAILAQTLICFGNCVGRCPHFSVEADRHYLNLFGVLVGATSKARKGTALSHVRRPFAALDPDWEEQCVKSGLTSGEGLVWSVRDVVDPQQGGGVFEKRLLVVEQEFAQVLKLMARHGNILSTVVRAAWDNGDLRTMSKKAPAVATGAHVSIIGHITSEELRRYLTLTEQANGFANRFLWLCVNRSKLLPEGGRIREEEMSRLTQRLKKAVGFARTVREMRRDQEARDLWSTIYGGLSEGRPGLGGCVISRAEAQVTRLSCIYALLDNSRVVRAVHLQAACALWKYAEASAAFIFGDSLGDPVADELWRTLKDSPNGMTRTQISNHFARNRSAHEIERALTLLAQQGLAKSVNQQTTGRPVQRWHALNPVRRKRI